MKLRIIGAGLPRTGTRSLGVALEHLIGGRCYTMSDIPEHPFNLGDGWNGALADETTDWHKLLNGFAVAVDWPASLFWRELSEANPDALVVLSVRDSAEEWWDSFNDTVLLTARIAQAKGWNEGKGLLDLLERFSGTTKWDDPVTMMASYERYNAAVRKKIAPHRLLEWRVSEGWEPICRALVLAEPTIPFPWVNRRSDWG
ncbi:sulfotransferase family protein [Bacillus sp. EB600]|uniref:sulfotransferase family protein n=1 Tax=Bacillus sp. EB600 TaxID=2806345 RepID=UPI00210C1966|nr:sulfotransferase family protein [Bacillus sp. EB600]MCQ6278530.1 hypothetical protein [Bacillus sp. EB600]